MAEQVTLSALERAVVLYDDQCGFCKWSLDRVLAWDRHRALRAVAIQRMVAQNEAKMGFATTADDAAGLIEGLMEGMDGGTRRGAPPRPPTTTPPPTRGRPG